MNDEREIISNRVLDGPRELVFRAFSDPNHLAAWWGPKDFRNTIHEFDFRSGAHWRLTMHGPDSTDYENEYVLLEIVEPERIVIIHPDPEHHFQLAITLVEEGEKTRLTWRMHFESAEHCHEVKPFVTDANEQNLDRLAAELARMMPSRAP